MNKKNFKRVISIILVLVFVLGFMPSGVINPARAVDKTLSAQDDTGTVTEAVNPGWNTDLPVGNAWGAGNYIVTGARSFNSTVGNLVTVTGVVNIWIDTGASLTVTAATGTNTGGASGNTGGNPSGTAYGIDGVIALTINSGASLTFSGPGTINITGGIGGVGGGYNRAGNLIANNASGSPGSRGGTGGYAISNAGTLTFAAGMSGNVTITGGVGGRGGDGQGSGTNTGLGTTIRGGSGGTGGTGGVAINNTGSGTVVFNQDNLNYGLARSESTNYSTGNINIKGGKGGVGGYGGDAGTAQVSVTGSRPDTAVAHASRPPAYTDVVQRANTQGGSSIGGTGGFGVQSGTVRFNSGVATIEGGNREIGQGSNAYSTVAHSTSWWGTTQVYYSIREQVVNPGPEPPRSSVFYYQQGGSATHTAHYSAAGSSGSPRAATNGVTIENNGGTNYLFGGDSGSVAAMSSGSVTSVGNNTGSLYAGGTTGFGFSPGTLNIQLSYLEGFADALGRNNFADHAKNFYVLNAGDTWNDATGRQHTSSGIQVRKPGGVTSYLNAKDVYVNPQGWLYLSGVDASDTITFDVAVGATLHGSAGSATKDVRLSKPGSGVYRFSGSMNPVSEEVIVTVTSPDLIMNFQDADARRLDEGVVTITYGGDDYIITIPLKATVTLIVEEDGYDDVEVPNPDFDGDELPDPDDNPEFITISVPVLVEREEVTVSIDGSITMQKFLFGEEIPSAEVTIAGAPASLVDFTSIPAAGVDSATTDVKITGAGLSDILSEYNDNVLEEHKILITGDAIAVARLEFLGVEEDIPNEIEEQDPYTVISDTVDVEIDVEVLTTSAATPARITARWAFDSPAAGANDYDSSFDVYWLQAQDFSALITINNGPQLAAIAWAVNNGIPGAANGNYRLGAAALNDIDLGSFSWTPIGTLTNPFTGSFDGNGRTIRNMRIDEEINGVEAYGLFGYTKGATIGNFTMTRDNFMHVPARTVRVNSNGGASVNTSGGGFSNLATNVIKVERDGNIFAGAAVGHATDTNINNITAIGLDVTATSTAATATVAVGGIVGRAVNTKQNPAERLNYSGLTFTGGSFTTVESPAVPPTPSVTINTGYVKAIGGATAFAGGIAGDIENINLTGLTGPPARPVTVTNSAVSADADGTAWAGGLVGRAVNSRIAGGSVNKTAANVTADPAYLYNDLTAKGGTGLAYAGGIVGQITGTQTTASEVSGNTVIHTIAAPPRPAVIRATAGTGTASHAYAGGILGHGLETIAFNNQFLDPVSSAATINRVEALAPSGSAWAGGHVGLIRNDGYFRVAIADATITNVRVVAAGASEAAPAAGEAFAGGLAGQIFSLRGAEFVNINIHGVQPTVANATRDAHAARIVGFATRADIINAGFNNPGTTAGAVSVTAASASGDAYAAGVAGKIVINGSINASSVRNTNINADSNRTIWAGGIVGYAENTPITGSDVNRWMDGATETFLTPLTSTTAITVTGAPSSVFAGGIGGEIINGTNGNDEKGKYHYIANSAVSVTKTLPETTARANVGGLYGKINNALIGISYARNYTINTNTGTAATSNATDPNYRLAGIAAELRNSELIVVYGVPSRIATNAVNDHTVTAYPGMYHTGGGNSFSSTYVVHTSFSARESSTTTPRDGNTYANTYYVRAGGTVITPGPNDAIGSSAPVAPANVGPFYMITGGGANRELLEQRGGQTFKYTNLTGVPHGDFKGTSSRVSDSIWALVHYYRTLNNGEITTQYERRLGVSVNFTTAAYTLAGNWEYPVFAIPIGFTLAVNPGLDYGYVAEGSSFTTPGTRIFAPNTELKFIALETPTLPRDDWFYSFTHWQITSGSPPIRTWGPSGTASTMGTGTSPQRYNESILHVMTAGAPMSATANFVRNDNRLRAAINTAISDRMIEVLMDDYDTDDEELSVIGKAIQNLLNAGPGQNKELALHTLIDAMFDGPGAHDFLSIFDFHITQGSNYVGTTKEDYPYGGLDQSGVGLPSFGTVYPNANSTAWNNLVDTEAVAKAIVRDALEAVVKNDAFSTGSHEYDISQVYDPEFKNLIFTDNPNDYRLDPGHGSYNPLVRYSISPIREDMLNFIDIGVDIFSGSGSFNKYVASQYAFEQSGEDTGFTNNTKPGISSATGMTVTIDTLFNGNGDPLRNPATQTFGHGSSGGVYISYVDPTGVASGDWDAHWGSKLVKNAVKNADGEFTTITTTIDWTKAVADTNGDYYIYMREVDENGFEVVTRMKVGVSSIASENIRINEGGASQQVGGGASDPDARPGEDLRVEDLALWWDEIEIMKANPGTVLTDKAGSDIGAQEPGDKWYTNGRGGGVRPTTLTATPIEGAYAEGIYIELAAHLVEGNTINEVTAFLAANPWLAPIASETNFFESTNSEGDKVYQIKITASALGVPAPDHMITPIMLWNGTDYVDSFPATRAGPFPESRQLEVFAPSFSDGDFRSGQFTYIPTNDVRVVVKYVDLLDEINAAGNNLYPAITGECEVWNVIRHGYKAPHSKFVDIFGIQPAIWTEFLNQIGGPGELVKEYDLLTNEVPVADLIKQLTPDNGGYPGTQPVKDLFTFVVALQELNDLYEANEAEIELFSAADKERLKRIKALADNLLDGKDENGRSISASVPADLNEILELYYNTLHTYNQLLRGSEYDTTTITIITNHPGKTPALLRSWVTNLPGLTDITTSGLFGPTLADNPVITPPPAPIAMMSLSILPETYPGGLLTEQIIVVKGKDANFNILPLVPNMTFVAEFMGEEGTPLTFPITRSTANNLVLTVIYTYNQYEVTVPGTVVDGAETLAIVTNNAVYDPDDDSESIEHGKTLIITITPTPGNVVMPGENVMVQIGTGAPTAFKVTAGPNGVGIVTIPNVTGDVTVPNFGNAVRELEADALEDYIEYLKLTYPNDDALDYTPPTWNNLIDAIEKAEEYLDPGTSDDIRDIYRALIDAEARLRKQFKINLSPPTPRPNLVVKGSALIDDPAPSDADYRTYKIPDAVPPGDDDIEYVTIQPGVVRIGSDYYVAEGFNIVLEMDPAVPANADLIVTKSTYDDGRTPSAVRDALINSDSSIIIRDVRGEVSGITLTTLGKAFDVYLNDGGKGSGTPGTDPDNPTHPTYTVTPPYGEHVSRVEVTTDGKSGMPDAPVELPPGPYTGNVTVDNPALDYTVTFITDIDDENYGSAEIKWRAPNKDNHIITPGTGPAAPYTKNKYDVSVPSDVATTTTPTVDHGGDVEITINPGPLDPDGRITITIKGVQGEDDIVIQGTLSTLEDEAEKLGVEIDVTGRVITVKDVTGPVEMDTKYLFVEPRDDDAILVAIEELRLALILAEQIKDNAEPFTGIYVMSPAGDPEWTKFTREAYEGGGLFRSLTDMTGEQDEEKVRNARLRRAIELAETQADLVKVINALLDEDEPLSATEILLMIEDAKDELMEAIHNLRLNGSDPNDFIAGVNDVQVSDGIEDSPLPEITLTDDAGIPIPGPYGPIDPGVNGIIITDIVEEDGYTYTGVEITVLDDEGKPHIVVIPATKPGNTTGDKPGPYTTTITADELEEAIKAALGIDDVDDVKVIAVKVVATKDPVDDGGGIRLELDPADTATEGKGFEDSGSGIGDVILTGDDLVIDNIVTDPGFELTDVVITVTNPLTGEDIKVVVPVTDPRVIVGPGSGDVGEKITIGYDDLEDILKDAIYEAVKDEFGLAVADKLKDDDYTAVITDVTVNSKGGDDVIDVPLTAVPGDTGIDKSVEITVSTPGSNDPDDNDGKYDGGIPTGAPHPNPDDIVDIVIDNITLTPGYTTGEVTIELTDDKGNKLTIVLDLLKDGDDMITVTGTPAPGFVITDDILDLLEDIKKHIYPGAPRKEKVTIPGELIKEIVDTVTGFADDGIAPDITKITVNGAREGYVIDLDSGTAPTGGAGVFSPGDILVRSNDETKVTANVNTSKDFLISGIEAPDAHDVARIEVDMILDSGNPAGKLIIIPEYNDQGDITGFRFNVRDSIGNPYTVPQPILAGIEEVMMDNLNLKGTGLKGKPMSVIFPGGSLDELFAAMPVPAVGIGHVDAFYQRDGLVYASRPAERPEVTGMDKTLKELDAMVAPALLPIVGDLVIDNIRLEEGYALDTVTVTVTVDGDKTFDIDVPITIFMLDEATNGGDQQKITIPGEQLHQGILNAVSNYSASMDIRITEIKIGATDEFWVVPPAMVVTENAKHGLVDVKFSYGSEYSFAEVIGGNVGGGGPSLSIPRGGLLSIDLKFEADDYPRTLAPGEDPFYHTLDSIRIGDVIISANDLRTAGVLTDVAHPDLQSGHPLFGLRRDKASYTLDIDMLYFLYNAVSTDADGPFDLSIMQLITSPQNTQYQSFIIDYHGSERFPGHEGLLDLEKFKDVGRDDDNFDKRLKYEGMVEKLLDQFTGIEATNPFRLTDDNEEHLSQYYFDLVARMDEIETLREAENVMYEVDDIYNKLFPIKSGDGLDNGGDPPITLNSVEDVIDFLNDFDYDDATEAELDVIKQITELIDELFKQIEDVLDAYDDLSDDGKGVLIVSPFPRDRVPPPTKPTYEDALDELRDLLIAIEESLLDDAGYFDLLVSRVGDVPDFVPESQLTRPGPHPPRDWVKDHGASIAERIVELEKAALQIDKAEEAWDALSAEDKVKAVRSRGILDEKVAELAQERKDLEELLKEFVDDFLTWTGEDEYLTNAPHHSADSLTGIRLPRPANRPLTPSEEADLLRGIDAYFKLPLILQDEIDKIFHHPTVKELAILYRDYDPVRPIDPYAVRESVEDELTKLKERLVDEHGTGNDGFEGRMDEILEKALDAIEDAFDRFESDDIVFVLNPSKELSDDGNKIVITFLDDDSPRKEVVITITIDDDGTITGITVEIDGVETKDTFNLGDYDDLVNVSDDGKTITVTSDKVKDLIDDHNRDTGTDPKIIIKDYPVRLTGELRDDGNNVLDEDEGKIGHGDIAQVLSDINDIREEARFKLQKEAAVKAIWNEYYEIADAISKIPSWDDDRKEQALELLKQYRDAGLGNAGSGNAGRGQPLGVDGTGMIADFGRGMTYPAFKETDVLVEWATTIARMRSILISPTISIPITPPGNGNDPPSTGTSSGSDSSGILVVLVDGVPHNVGTMVDEDGVRTVTFDQDALHAEIENGTDHVRVIVPYDSSIGTYEVEFRVINVEEMADKSMTLIIDIGPLTYTMPSTAVDTEAIMAALGATDPAEVPFIITIVKTVCDDTQARVDNTLDSLGKQQMHMPLQFHITATYDGKTVEANTFKEYVSRTIEVSGAVARRITTGVIVCEIGSSRHVPTDVFRVGNRYYATINSLTNSTYVLIYYDASFDDVNGTWYTPCVDEKASRTIVKGREDGLFYSQDDITRAEFAAIIIRALGLAPDGNGRIFRDVPANVWYAGYVGKAHEYGLIEGIGGGLYEPERTISREEAMLIIQRAAGIAGYTGRVGNISSFPDANRVSSWALNAARWNVGSELILGRDGVLDPKANITRAETSSLVLRLLRNAGLIDEREFSQPDLYRS